MYTKINHQRNEILLQYQGKLNVHVEFREKYQCNRDG